MIKYSRDAIKCPECNSFYYFSQINVLDEHYKYLVPNIRIYMQQLINTLLTKGEKDINKYIMEKHISEKVRIDRKQYLENSFPSAINLIIDICFPKQLTKIQKENMSLIKNSNTSTKVCLNPLCKGILIQTDQIFECTFCSSKTCVTCDTIITPNHVCDEAILSSIRLLSEFIKCPKCYAPVEKIDGCNNMTCGICNSTFDYVTGEFSDYGSHNPTPMVIKEKTILNQLIHPITDPELIEALDYLENNSPKLANLNSVYRAIIDNNIHKTIALFDKYLYHIEAIKFHTNKIEKIIAIDKLQNIERKKNKIISLCYAQIKKM